MIHCFVSLRTVKAVCSLIFLSFFAAITPSRNAISCSNETRPGPISFGFLSPCYARLSNSCLTVNKWGVFSWFRPSIMLWSSGSRRFSNEDALPLWFVIRLSRSFCASLDELVSSL